MLTSNKHFCRGLAGCWLTQCNIASGNLLVTLKVIGAGELMEVERTSPSPKVLGASQLPYSHTTPTLQCSHHPMASHQELCQGENFIGMLNKKLYIFFT